MGDRRSSRDHAGLLGQGGFILALVLLVIAFLTSLSAAGLTRSTTERTAAGRFTENERAFQLAEGGLDHALAALSTSSTDWSDELMGADGLAGTADDGVLSFGLVVPLPLGTYTVRVSDNPDEVAPTPDDPMTDADGILRIDTVGTTAGSQRAITAWVSALFNYAIAAQVDILLRQASALGGIHANRNIEVRQTSELLGCSQATASGTFIIPAGETLVHTCGDLVGGDAPVEFLRPDVDVMRQAVTRWNPADAYGTIQLLDRELVGYDIPLDVPPDTPQTVKLTGAATLVVFDGHSIRFRQRLGTFRKNGTCLAPLDLNIISTGGSIIFEQPVCLRGLIWADGSISIAQNSTISGAVVSADGSIDVKQSSSIAFNRTALDQNLLAGFGRVALLAWEEQ